MGLRSAALITALASIALAVVPVAFGGDNAGITPREPASETAESINELYIILLVITGVIFLIVEGALLLFIFRFRRRRGTASDVEGPQIHGNTRLEMIWIGVPVLILIAIIAVTLVKVPSVEASPEPGEPVTEVAVDGYQYYWNYTYPNGVIVVNDLRLPVGQTASLVLTSPDVVHSWWVPELAGKLDAIPGEVNTLNFKPDAEGTYVGQCAEFCGLFHALMRTTVEVIPQAEFDAWLVEEEERQAAGTSNLGEQTYIGACSACHGLAGEGDLGPPLAGNSNATDRNALVEILVNGRNSGQFDTFMPAVGRGWSDRQIDALLGYLQALEPQPEGDGG